MFVGLDWAWGLVFVGGGEIGMDLDWVGHFVLMILRRVEFEKKGE